MQSQRYGLDQDQKQIWITTTMQALAKAGLGLSDCQVLITMKILHKYQISSEQQTCFQGV